MRRNQTAPSDDAALDAAVRSAMGAPPVISESVERRHVVAAAAAATRSPAVGSPVRGSRARTSGRQRLAPRWAGSLPALTGLFATLPGKAAAAVLVSVTGVSGLAATGNLPEPAQSALQAAAETIGWELPGSTPPPVASDVAPATPAAAEKADDRDRARRARAAAKARKDAGLQKADSTPDRAGARKDAGVDGASSSGTDTAPRSSGDDGAANAAQPRAPRAQAGGDATLEQQRRTEAKQTEQQVRTSADDTAPDASDDGAVRETDARTDAEQREYDGRSDGDTTEGDGVYSGGTRTDVPDAGEDLDTAPSRLIP